MYQIEANHVQHELLTPHVTPTCTPCPMVLGRRRKGTLFGTSLGFAGVRLHLHLVEGERGFRWHHRPEHVAVVGQRMHPRHGDLADRQQVLSVLRPQGGCAALQSKETGSVSISGENLQRSPSPLLFGLKPRADVHLGVLQRVCSPGGTPKLCRAGRVKSSGCSWSKMSHQRPTAKAINSWTLQRKIKVQENGAHSKCMRKMSMSHTVLL